MTRFAEDDPVLLIPAQGGQPDQGKVLAVSPDGARVLVRWCGPGGLRATRWEAVTEQLVRPERPADWSRRAA